MTRENRCKNANLTDVKNQFCSSERCCEFDCWASMLESERSLWLMIAMGSRCLIGGDLGVSDCRVSELIGFDNYVQFRSLHLQFIILSLSGVLYL